MYELTSDELQAVNGGISKFLIAGIIAAGVFVIGVIDGYLRPYTCR